MESPVIRRAVALNSEAVIKILQNNSLDEFVEFAKEKNLDGRSLQEVTNGTLRNWKPNCNADKFITFLDDFKKHSFKYTEIEIKKETVSVSIESQYQTVDNQRKVKEKCKSIDEIMKNIVPAKSFLYRYHKPIKLATPYTPMDVTPKKSRRFFRLSAHEYPLFDLKSRFSRHDNFNDRGYYSIKNESKVETVQKATKKPNKTKYMSISSTNELKDEISEDHFYEDLCYDDMSEEQDKNSTSKSLQMPQVVVRPCVLKIQELFNTFKLPFFKRADNEKDAGRSKQEEDNIEVKDLDFNKHHSVPLYENNDSLTEVMYDYPIKQDRVVPIAKEIYVEDYLEPIPVEKDYCDVGLPKEDSLLSYIMNIFENFGIKKETSETDDSDESQVENIQEIKTAEKPKRPVDRKLRGTSMADRPLPVPVENEPYYMNVTRVEAESLLMGHPDGTFILRPTTQPNHAYTLTVACCNAVHNVGVRRRPDGRLALGYARKGERSFTSIASLLRHHKKRRLLLVASGGVLGATTLNESPVYYQAPRSLPVNVLPGK